MGELQNVVNEECNPPKEDSFEIEKARFDSEDDENFNFRKPAKKRISYKILDDSDEDELDKLPKDIVENESTPKVAKDTEKSPSDPLPIPINKLFEESDLFDAEESDEECKQEQETSKNKNIKSNKKLKQEKEPKKGNIKTKKSMKMEKEDALNMHSETQRLIRQSRVSLPYNKPQQKTLQYFLNRKKNTPTEVNPILIDLDKKNLDENQNEVTSKITKLEKNEIITPETQETPMNIDGEDEDLPDPFAITEEKKNVNETEPEKEAIDLNTDKTNICKIEKEVTPNKQTLLKSSSLTPSMTALRLRGINFEDLTPKLGGSGIKNAKTVVDLDANEPPSNIEVSSLIQRYVNHTQELKKNEKKIEVVNEENEKRKIVVAPYNCQNETPGAQLLSLKQSLRVKIMEKREIERKKRIEVHKIDNEEGFEDEDEDENELEEEAEFTDQTDTEEDEDDEDDIIGFREKKIRRSIFIDDEADEEDADDENEDDADEQDESESEQQVDECEDLLEKTVCEEKSRFDDSVNENDSSRMNTSVRNKTEDSFLENSPMCESTPKNKIRTISAGYKDEDSFLSLSQPAKCEITPKRNKHTSNVNNKCEDSFLSISQSPTCESILNNKLYDRNTNDNGEDSFLAVSQPLNRENMQNDKLNNSTTFGLGTMMTPAQRVRIIDTQSPKDGDSNMFMKKCKDYPEDMEDFLPIHTKNDEKSQSQSKSQISGESQFYSDDFESKLLRAEEPKIRKLFGLESSRHTHNTTLSQSDDDLLLCSGKFKSQSLKSQKGKISNFFGPCSNMTQNEDEIDELCSGRFELQSLKSEKVKLNNFFGSCNNMTQNTEEINDLCSGKFVSQLPNLEESETGNSFFDERKRKRILSDSESDEFNNTVVEFDNFEESVRKNNFIERKRKRIESDEESDKFINDEEETDDFNDNVEANYDCDDTEDENREAMYNDEEEEVVTEKIKRRKKIREFFENEAEISGSEGSSDEEERPEDDILEDELGDQDEIKLSQEALREQVGRVYLKDLMDEDNRDMRIFKEAFLQDGDLHTDGKGRERKFRWKDMYNDLDQETGMNSADENEDEKEEDAKWRLEKLEREKWLQENAKKNEEEEENEIEVLNFKTKTHLREAITVEKTSVPSNLLSPVTSSKSKFQRGSFFSKAKQSSNKISEKTKPSDANPMGIKNSRKFVFAPITPPRESAPEMKEELTVRKKPKLERKNLNKQFVSEDKNSIFKFL